MKLTPNTTTRRRAFSLVEMLVYLSVVGLVMSLTVTTLFQLITQTRDLRRNCEDIAKTTQAGERWRDDIRNAVTEPTTTTGPGGSVIEIPTTAGPINYSRGDETLWRQIGNDGAPEPILRRVKSSQLIREQRGDVSGWRWEIELATRRKGGPLKPLFSFIAVAGYNLRK